MKKILFSFLMILFVTGFSFAHNLPSSRGNTYHGRFSVGIRTGSVLAVNPRINRFEQRRLIKAARFARRDGRISRKEAVILHEMRDRSIARVGFRGNRFCR